MASVSIVASAATSPRTLSSNQSGSSSPSGAGGLCLKRHAVARSVLHLRPVPRMDSRHVVEEGGAVPRRARRRPPRRFLAAGVEQSGRVDLQVGDVGGRVHPGGACHV